MGCMPPRGLAAPLRSPSQPGGGLPLAVGQTPTSANPSSPSSAAWQRKRDGKALGLRQGQGDGQLPITVMGKTDSTWGKLI